MGKEAAEDKQTLQVGAGGGWRCFSFFFEFKLICSYFGIKILLHYDLLIEEELLLLKNIFRHSLCSRSFSVKFCFVSRVLASNRGGPGSVPGWDF